MDKDHEFMLKNILIFGDLFFFTTDGIKDDDAMIQHVLADLYKTTATIDNHP